MILFSLLIVLLLVIVPDPVFAHSWNEQLSLITNGSFTGSNGYPRSYVPRTMKGFYDDMMNYRLPPSDNRLLPKVNDTDFLCAPNQRRPMQTEHYPRLQVTPGSFVAIKYLENGHVTKPENTPGKPRGSGRVYVYGTTRPAENEYLTNVLRWNEKATGGDKRGRLLTTQNFDDQRCYEINDSRTSLARQKQFPNHLPGQPGSPSNQWCETDIMIPKDLMLNSQYTIYWVWDWPTAPSQVVPDGKDEYYTTCTDLEIVGELTGTITSNPLLIQDPQVNAVPGYQTRAEYGDCRP